MSNAASLPYVEEDTRSTFRPNPSLQPMKETNTSVYPDNFVLDNTTKGILWGLALSSLFWLSLGMLVVATF